jgi:hypothetical protein
VYAAKTPRLRVSGYETRGTYPQVRRAGLDLRAVNAALRAAVLADERAYAPYARRQRARVPTERGVYRTAVDRKLVSASSVVVSALLPLTREAFPGQSGGDGWLPATVRVPSGARVTIDELFTSPGQGLRALAIAWKAAVRKTAAAPCLRIYPEAYTATVGHYSAFALTPRGLAVGSWEIAACYRLLATVPYSVLRPYLSRLGLVLVAGVRRPG